MIPGDYTSVCDKNGKEIGRKIVSYYGNEYVVGKKLGAGGVAKVYHAQKIGDKKEYVFKEFVPSPELVTIHRNIKMNIIDLIKEPLTAKNSNVKLPHFVPPLDIVELPASGGFGYIMEKIDLSEYKSIATILNHKELYPDAKILCKLCKEFAIMFDAIHGRGFCYKDINEGNIYINPKNGDFLVIDCDNVGVESRKTILGTLGYIAPEVICETTLPDTRSDYFSIAAFFFRLFVGSYPMYGPGCDRYMEKNNLTEDGAAMYIYGTNAVFAFNPADNSNAAYLDTVNNDYKIQTRKWNALPPQIRKLMVRTFVKGLPYNKRTLRTSNADWIKCFEDLENNHLVQCKKCKRYNFDNRKICFSCGKDLPTPSVAVKNPFKKATVASKPAVHGYEVVFEYLRMVNGKTERGHVTFDLNEKVSGKRLHPDFPNKLMLEVIYHKDKDIYTICNHSDLTWELSREGKVVEQSPGKEVRIRTDLIIKVDKSKCLLKVLGARKK